MKEIIIEAIRRFDFSNYGLDDLDELKEQPSTGVGTDSWVHDLAAHIARAIEAKK
jgi:hypothetical protein